ncbi:UTP--glucose-1-phosphate uridylyltransferase 3, chloroplastic [Primulina huaijiensis]|uniref:UTP--glucose-1-phosphate uridylyltransferase 3, chloroplastic n=1 Tax=Primulina huaijiensis TaxID=1492673 RepID=UPI003CC73577
MAHGGSAPVLHNHNPLRVLKFKPSRSPFFLGNPCHNSISLNFSPSAIVSWDHPRLCAQSRDKCFSVTCVSTVPVEYAPPAPESDWQKEIGRLKALRKDLDGCRTLGEKLKVVSSDSRVELFFKSRGNKFAGAGLSRFQLYLLKCVVAAGQQHVLSEFGSECELEMSSVRKALYSLVEMIENWDGNGGGKGESLKGEETVVLESLLKMLGEVEQFYDCIGGIVGYQLSVLELLTQSPHEGGKINIPLLRTNKLLGRQFVEIHPPTVLDLSENTEYASKAALWGIEGLPDLGEIYPLGGSADRLGLVDTETGECLPAAMLPYCGRTLLEGLIRDLQAREFLYFKLYGKQCITPVAIMTSAAKNNHLHITGLCEKLRWFGRGRLNFHIFDQPLVPAVTAEDGQWIVERPLVPVCKPGGHGVIWKLAHDKGVFKWFNNHGRKGATVRQISNVVAATDLTLLALAGIGLRHRKKLGFASCQRNSGATEGINVLLEKKNLDGKWAYGVSCVEYTEFDKFGITVDHLSHNSLQAEFPANTNILYVDLHSAELIGSSKDESSLPGMVLNVKKPITYVDHFGMKHCVSGGRLECTMQNIADNFSNTFPSRCYKVVEDALDTFIVYNDRRKVTSSAKKRRGHTGKSLHQTPDGSLLDIMRNAYDLLSYCGIEIPKVEGNEVYVDSGPPFLIFLHPALGPLWEVTKQKFQGGFISKGSELQIEVAEFLWRDVQLHGSLIISSENVMGSATTNEGGDPILQYGRRCAKCKLKNVKVLNDGIDWSYGENLYWKHEVQRFEALKVILHGNAEFEAIDVVIQGNHVFDVPNGHRMQITSGKSGLEIQLKPIEEELMDSGTWFWNYKITGTHIQLELTEI